MCKLSCFILCLLLASCTLWKPLPLKPFDATASTASMAQTGLSSLNGDYQILAADTSNRGGLDEVFFYSYLFNYKKPPSANDFVRLEAIDREHIKASLFINNKRQETKTLKGRLYDNYFQFHKPHLKFRFIINVYEQQTSRLALWKDGALYVDNNHGGIAFFIFLPIPLSGAAMDSYHLKFTRRR